MIHLDTNAAIALLNGSPPQVRKRFDDTIAAGTPVAISAIVYFELQYGAAASVRVQDNENKIALFLAAGGIEILQFGEAEAHEAGEIRAHLRAAKTPIGPYDLLIAAQARVAGAMLVTANTREFDRVPGLSMVDWAG
ncbi:MAG: type II toxin-antitoxin system VapC family toxin [Beijerinckiaceae bacterium]